MIAPQLRGRAAERGSLPLALLASIIVAGLIVVLVVRIVGTQSLSRFDQGFHASLPVADAGVNLGKFMLNNEDDLYADECLDADGNVFTPPDYPGPYEPSDFPVGCTTEPEEDFVDGDPYTFTLTRLSEVEWEIDSTGTDARSGIERRAIGTIRERPLVSVALFAESLISFSGSNAADSYTSDEDVPQDESWCTGSGFIATNGVATTHGVSGGPCHEALGYNRTVDRVFLWNWAAEPGEVDDPDVYPGGDRCDHTGGGGGANCREVSPEDPTYLEPEIRLEHLDYATPAKVAFIEAALDACDEIKDKLSTSDLDDGVLGPGPFDPGETEWEFPGDVDGPYHCVKHLDFDETTKIDGTKDEPVIVVVRDLITVKGRGGGGGGQEAHVGCEDDGDAVLCVPGDPSGDGASRPQAARLWVFLSDEGTFEMGNHAAFAGVMWGPGPETECVGSAQGDIYGSLLCGNVENVGGWKFHYDEDLMSVSSGEFFTASWREEPRN